MFVHPGPRPHVFVGAVVAAPLFFYPPPSPVYYYPPVPLSPPAYIEQEPAPGGTAPPAPSANQYWYWCAGSNAYYPYVKECPGGWQPVLPQPPSS